MTEAFEKFAKLRALYPDDGKRIEEDEKRLNELLAMQEFATLPVVRGLVDKCREDILFARKALATNRQLTVEARAELWHIIDAREWFVKLVVKDFAAEVAQLSAELDRELSS